MNNLVENIVIYQDCLQDIKKGFAEIKGEFDKSKDYLIQNNGKYMITTFKNVFGAEISD